MDLSNLMLEIESLRVELDKFERGNNSAGTRARKVCQNIKKSVQDIREKIQEKKGASKDEE
ncbi:MAG: hypothetical protein JNL74_17195 [Fibrobacteres bacterium]|nr:hypothetical protein [Fibrobacterota bacterium]